MQSQTLEKSSDVAIPLCPHFGSCGGCSYQDVSYERQLELKRLALQDQLGYLVQIPHQQIRPLIPSPKQYHYRNSLTFSIRQQSGVPYLGFIEKDKRTFFPVEHCAIGEDKLNRRLPQVISKFVERIPEKERYRTSQIAVRVGCGTEYYTTIRDRDADQTLSAFVLGKQFKYPGHSFFQVNDSILDAFVTALRNLLQPSDKRDLVDLYCGVGLFALSLADGYQQVLGIEEGPGAIQFARENAKINGITNTRFIDCRTEDALAHMQQFSKRLTDVIVDPPRVGMRTEAIQLIKALPNLKHLIYVSCNPEALARDLSLLGSHFKVEMIQPVDMFPQTKHVETIVLLTLNSAWGRF